MGYVVHGHLDGNRVELACRDIHAAHDTYWYLKRRFPEGCELRIESELRYVLVRSWPLYALALALGALAAIL